MDTAGNGGIVKPIVGAAHRGGRLVRPDVWGANYDEINAFEHEIVDGGASIVTVAVLNNSALGAQYV
ncbi:hypothetical protein MDOR_03190 [Mycolicibacterium doricum]|jgi:hypothetical protein|uniref:Uncharacterized protein n=1 Tax=Mycolicibacterium doricum TaxID=126673 RepID=A0A1X1SWG2_9MYCO|nr:hypothetical protein [Mycolicibacterium doricum]MCV7267901.1 hypothetical protein [Mycolicibacterium doricum]ORV35249.1 hypothetical protein AWC01_00710 [Mycolicibacterium doricum]BBZ06150.1 hypothetical protein MDOR_03190 [Mycolicibacterium doricum]